MRIPSECSQTRSTARATRQPANRRSVMGCSGKYLEGEGRSRLQIPFEICTTRYPQAICFSTLTFARPYGCQCATKGNPLAPTFSSAIVDARNYMDLDRCDPASVSRAERARGRHRSRRLLRISRQARPLSRRRYRPCQCRGQPARDFQAATSRLPILRLEASSGRVSRPAASIRWCAATSSSTSTTTIGRSPI